MKTNFFSPLRALSISLFVCFIQPHSVSAGTLGVLTYTITNDLVTITECDESAAGFILIPEKIEGKPVIKIGSRAFEFCRSITDVSIPDSIFDIGDEAFGSCKWLENVYSYASNVPAYGQGKLGDRAFLNCRELTYVEIPPAIKIIGNYSFLQCERLPSLTIPQGVTNIEDGVFTNCESLVTMNFPNSVTVIGKDTFFGCSSLDSVFLPTGMTAIPEGMFNSSGLVRFTIPDHITSVGMHAFSACYMLDKIVIPEGVESIGYGGFSQCWNLTQVDLPASMEYVGQNAFNGCSKLKDVLFLGNAPTLGSSAFAQVDTQFTVFYLHGSYGFSSPTWEGYPAKEVGPINIRARDWLAYHGLSLAVPFSQDVNGDGVSVLMAYALNLNPNNNLSTSLPRPVLNPNSLSLTYYSMSDGVTYRVETSKNLTNWSDTGVTVGTPDSNGRITATISREGACGFMRLVVVVEE